MKNRLIEAFPAVGYSDKKMTFIHFEFYTTKGLYAVRKYLQNKFPKPTKKDIENGYYKVLNERVICEDKEEPIKFIVFNDLISAGWVELKPYSYTQLDASLYNR